MPDSNTLHAGHTFGGGRFVLIRLLGRGGMGEVWLATDQRLKEQVALKFLPSEVQENPPTLEHLRLETARSHRLTHPHIVRLHDFHEPAGEPAFISMEYVDGPSLNRLRMDREKGVLSWKYLSKPLAQLCEALDYAHAENVIHRDLKPDNLLIDSRGRLKLTDFGVAAMASDLARTGSMKGGGTLAFMSPQQVAGKHPQVTDDIYALGATLYDLLTGQPPFYEGDLENQVLHQVPGPLQQRLAAMGIENDVPDEVAAMIMSCLAKDPAQRPQSARAVSDWLSSLDEGSRPDEPPAEPPAEEVSAEETLPEPGERRSMWALILAAFALVLLATGTGWFLKVRAMRKGVTATHVLPSRERWTNSLGMVFVPVPESEALFCIWKTRVQDYQAMVSAMGILWEKPAFDQGPTHPAVNIGWDDAKAYCKWLTQRERGMGVIATNQFYRLPTDEEWSLAVGLGHEPGDTPKDKDGKIKDVYPWGKEWPPPVGSGNFDQKLRVDDYPYTSPVGSFPSNRFALYDLAGNAREWCEDLYAPGARRRVVRGSSWFDTPALTLESSRRALTPKDRGDKRLDYFGFRCVLVTGAGPAPALPVAIVVPVESNTASVTNPDPAPTERQATEPTPMPAPARAVTPNTLTAEEIAAGWRLLFDGRTTAGWRGYKMPGFPAKGWHIADSCLVNPKSNGRPNGSGGDLVTVGKFLNFELSFEWRNSQGGNSGVNYFFDENRPMTPVPMYAGDTGNSPMGFEYQILDDPNYPRELKNGPKHLTAALYMLIAPSNKVLRPAGEFNEGRIVVNGTHVEHWLNGNRVLECELGSPSLLNAISKTKFKYIAGMGSKFATQIALQDHGDEVAFRNLKIRFLPPAAAN